MSRFVFVRAQVDALRLRLEEKESLLSKKSQQISELTEEKSTQQGEITDLKDMLDVKERKVNVLQKKVRQHSGRARFLNAGATNTSFQSCRFGGCAEKSINRAEFSP